MNAYRDGSQIGPRWRELLFLRLSLQLSRLPNGVTVRIAALGDSIRWIATQRRLFSGPLRIVRRREHIWDAIIADISGESTNGSVLFLEFGVAWGYATDYFLSRINESSM